MNMRPLIFVITLLAVIAAAYANVGRRNTGLGGYKPIKDLRDAHLQDIAKYVVTEHNKKAGSSLEYVKIVKGESQIVSGTNYRLEISAKDGATVHNYQAVVYEKPWAHFRSLTSFKAV